MSLEEIWNYNTFDLKLLEKSRYNCFHQRDIWNNNQFHLMIFSKHKYLHIKFETTMKVA
jgi:hypothetical protein